MVQGPDVIFGRDIRNFHVPAGRFDGVIGGPPCQPFSRLVHIVRAQGREPKHPNLIPEFERVVRESQPWWFLMENVAGAPIPSQIDCYLQHSFLLNNRWLGEVQNRERRFTFGCRGMMDSLRIQLSPLEAADWEPAVCSTAGGRRAPVKIGGSGKPKGPNGKTYEPLRLRSFSHECELQGLPADFLEGAPFTQHGKRVVVGNGVPLPMGRAVARAVKRALGIGATPEGATDP